MNALPFPGELLVFAPLAALVAWKVRREWPRVTNAARLRRVRGVETTDMASAERTDDGRWRR